MANNTNGAEQPAKMCILVCAFVIFFATKSEVFSGRCLFENVTFCVSFLSHTYIGIPLQCFGYYIPLFSLCIMRIKQVLYWSPQ